MPTRDVVVVDASVADVAGRRRLEPGGVLGRVARALRPWPGDRA